MFHGKDKSRTLRLAKSQLLTFPGQKTASRKNYTKDKSTMKSNLFCGEYCEASEVGCDKSYGGCFLVFVCIGCADGASELLFEL